MDADGVLREVRDCVLNEPLLHRFGGKEGRQVRDAETGDRCVEERLPVVDRQPTPGTYLPCLTRRRPHVPHLAGALVGVVQELVFLEVVDARRPAVLREVRRTGDHSARGLGDPACAHARVRKLAHEDRHIETLTDQFRRPVHQHHIDAELGEIREEFREDRRQVLHAEVGRGGEAKQARGLALHRRDETICLAGVIQDPTGPIVVGQADVSRRDPARCPIEEAGAEACLQVGHMLRDGGFGDPHLFGGIGEATLIDDRGECLHFCQSVHPVFLSQF